MYYDPMELEKGNTTWPSMYHERMIGHRVNSVECGDRQNVYDVNLAIEDDSKRRERFVGVWRCNERQEDHNGSDREIDQLTTTYSTPNNSPGMGSV